MRQLVLDEAVGRGVVGHAQERFRQHHQRQAFSGGEGVLVQQVLDAAEAAGARPDGRDQRRRRAVDGMLLIRRQHQRQQAARHDRVVFRIRRIEGGFCAGLHVLVRRCAIPLHTPALGVII